MHPHTWPQDLIEAWGRSGFGVKNNWPLRYRPSSKRCQTRSCEDLPPYHRSHLCLHLEQQGNNRQPVRNNEHLSLSYVLEFYILTIVSTIQIRKSKKVV